MTEKPKTVRVRIAVCVAADGEWNSAGWSGAGGGKQKADDELAGIAVDPMPVTAAVHFIEADIPLPQTIVGEVQADDRASITTFIAGEAARFEREKQRAIDSGADPAAERCHARASLCRTLAAQVQRGDDRHFEVKP